MLTRSEKTYLSLTLVFLAAGCGLKAWRRATVRLGPFPDAATMAQDSARAADSLSRPTAAVAADSGAPGAPSAPASGDSTAARAGSPAIGSAGEAGGENGPMAQARDAGRFPARKGFSGQIDLNRADAAGLMRIKGVGEKTAAAILAYRKEHGPFRDVRELLQIKGIGEKKLEKHIPHIIL